MPVKRKRPASGSLLVQFRFQLRKSIRDVSKAEMQRATRIIKKAQWHIDSPAALVTFSKLVAVAIMRSRATK